MTDMRPQANGTNWDTRTAWSVASARFEGGWWSRWWYAICVTALIVGSDYKFRARDPTVAVEGSIDGGIALELVLYAAVGGCLLLARGRLPHITRLPLPVYFACFFVGLMVASVVSAPFPQYAIVRAVQMCVLLALTLLAIATTDRGHFHRFAHLYMVLMILSIMYGVANPSPPLAKILEGRFSWFAVHPTVSGVMSGLGVVVAFGYAMWGGRPRPGPRWPRLVYVIAGIVLGFASLAIHTRGAVGASVVGCIIVLALVTARGTPRRRVLASLALGVLTSWLAASDTIAQYVIRDQETSDLTTLSQRTDLWALASEAAADRPLFGYGLGSSRSLFYGDTGLGGGHNALVNVLVELGAVGVVCFAALVISVVVSALKVPADRSDGRTLDRAVVTGIAGFLIFNGFFFEGAGAPTNVASTWLFVSVAWLAVLGPASIPTSSPGVRGTRGVVRSGM
jgi:exopolysaccharide production protein ExoQ